MTDFTGLPQQGRTAGQLSRIDSRVGSILSLVLVNRLLFRGVSGVCFPDFMGGILSAVFCREGLWLVLMGQLYVVVTSGRFGKNAAGAQGAIVRDF